MRGRIICIDGGGDRIGKHTQAIMLSEYIKGMGIDTKCLSFPNYGTSQAKPVEMYLRGELSDLTPMEASILFAFDRSVTFRNENIKEFLQAGGTLILDRYVSSNVVYQIARSIKDGEKIALKDSDKFIMAMKIEELEYTNLGLPRPDITIYLDLDREINKQTLKSEFENDNPDILESDNSLLDRVAIIGKQLADMCGWKVIKCDDGKKFLPKEVIHEKVIKEIMDAFNFKNTLTKK